MRLLLDEHFSPVIAEELRRHGHDVVAVAATPGLRHRQDDELLAWATSQGRTLVTENVADYVRLHELHLARGERHHGIVLTSARRFPRDTAGIGRSVRALDELLNAFEQEDAFLSDLYWLREAERR